MGFHTLFGDLQCDGSLLLQDANAGQLTHKLLRTTACALTTDATGNSDPVIVKRQGGAFGGVVSRAFARATLLSGCLQNLAIAVSELVHVSQIFISRLVLSAV